jgi:hypothetical protein
MLLKGLVCSVANFSCLRLQSSQFRMNGGVLQLLDARGVVIAKAPMNGNAIQTFAFAQYTCESSFQGGGWVLVRRVRQGSTSWHPATDNLAGTQAAYGVYGSATSDATFGVPYSSWVSGSTEFLFATGLLELCV